MLPIHPSGLDFAPSAAQREGVALAVHVPEPELAAPPQHFGEVADAARDELHDLGLAFELES